MWTDKQRNEGVDRIIGMQRPKIFSWSLALTAPTTWRKPRRQRASNMNGIPHPPPAFTKSNPPKKTSLFIMLQEPKNTDRFLQGARKNGSRRREGIHHYKEGRGKKISHLPPPPLSPRLLVLLLTPALFCCSCCLLVCVVSSPPPPPPLSGSATPLSFTCIDGG